MQKWGALAGMKNYLLLYSDKEKRFYFDRNEKMVLEILANPPETGPLGRLYTPKQAQILFEKGVWENSVNVDKLTEKGYELLIGVHTKKLK